MRQLRGDRLFLRRLQVLPMFLLALAASQVCAAGAHRASAQSASEATKPTSAHSSKQPSPEDATKTKTPLAVDVADPGISPGQTANQGTTGELPVDTPQAQPAMDSSALSGVDATPTPARRGIPGAAKIGAGSVIQFTLAEPLSSATQHNGDIVRGTLAAEVTTGDGKLLPLGTQAVGTIVSSARPGIVQSGGVLSVELTHVDGIPVVTDVRAFNGQSGNRDVADSNPGKGSDAEVPVGTMLRFQVMN